ncbi:MAG TPA: hypothetical protein VIK59_11835 [Verrucomicrobiae bacterium]
MKKVWHAVRARVLYLIFAFFVMIFVSAVKSGGKFHFRNGEELSGGQNIIALFVLFLLMVITGYGAYKRAQLDWKLWQKNHRPK